MTHGLKWQAARTMRALLLLIVGVFVVASSTALAEEAIKRGGVLRIIEPTGGTMIRNWNPYLAAGQSAPGTTSAIYEGLYYINPSTGEENPFLGVSYEWRDNNLTLVVETRRGVEWSDGTPFTAADVAFTFNFMKEHPGLDLNALWRSGLADVTPIDDHTVAFHFSEPNTPLWTYIAGTQIVPEHIWSDVEDPLTFANADPVGTGPFLVDRFSPQVITYVRNPNFWMEGRPYIDGVAIQSVRSNNTALLSLLSHEADYSYMFITDPERTWVGRDLEHNKYWWPVLGTNILFMNTLKAPYDDVAFRRAIGQAIDKQMMSDKAYQGVVAASDATGMNPGQQDEWLDPSLNELKYRYDPEAARETLADAGYTWTSGGDLVLPDGTPMPTMRLLVGAGWTDFISMAQVISTNLEVLGIQVVIEQEPWSTYMNSLITGTYDTAIYWGSGAGPDPYFLYYTMLDSRFSADAIGEEAASNFSRFTSPAIDEALATFRSSSDPAVQMEAITTIARVVLENVVFVPLTDRPNFSDYHTHNFVGWPSDENPYNAGESEGGFGAELMFLNVHLR